jgi:hypothetical protein
MFLKYLYSLCYEMSGDEKVIVIRQFYICLLHTIFLQLGHQGQSDSQISARLTKGASWQHLRIRLFKDEKQLHMSYLIKRAHKTTCWRESVVAKGKNGRKRLENSSHHFRLYKFLFGR